MQRNYLCPFYSTCLTEWAKKGIAPTCSFCKFKDLKVEEEIDLTSLLRLWAAVLKRAVDDYKEALTGNKKMTLLSLKRWFYNKNNNVGTFRWICDLLNINPEWFLKKLESQLFDEISFEIPEKDKIKKSTPTLIIKEGG
ncbi:MAG: hypothetical protein LWW95_08230 [Candidatus Desulfofervidus auxilii]|nr:hypothetical protein [Candidatus Desulfofervidus auxilii]